MGIKRWIGTTFTLATTAGVSFGLPSALALAPLTDATINKALQYGIDNQDMGMSSFLGPNWIEGSDGSLLNVFTPYMHLARIVAHRHFPSPATPDNIALARKKVRNDIDYIWQHPHIKFMVSLFGDDPHFARNYYARIEGEGQGRSFLLYPKESTPQYLTDKDPHALIHPYSGINAYQFDYEAIAPMDEFTLILYGKNVPTLHFKIHTIDIQ